VAVPSVDSIWRIQEFSKGPSQGVCGTEVPQWGPGELSLAGNLRDEISQKLKQKVIFMYELQRSPV